MSLPITLSARYDGTAIRLDEPFELSKDARLLVTVLSPDAIDESDAEWAQLGVDSLARAYGDDETDYTAADILP